MYNGAQLIIQIVLVVPLIILPILTTTKIFIYWGIITLTLVVFYLGKVIYDNSLLSFTRKDYSATKSDLSTIVKYSSSRLVADFFLFSLSAFPLIYISNSEGLQHTAFFSVGITFITMATPIFSFMGIILLPYVSKAIVSNKLEDAQAFIRKLAIVYYATAIAATMILYVFIQPLTTLFFASSYIVASDVSRIMILSIIPQSIYLLYRNPIDAISVVPYNIVILGVCLASIVISFALSSTLTQFAFAYLAVSILQGLLSWLTWKKLSNNYLKKQ
jgi:O-antigen/teichoic acid export membrane protein